MFRMNQIARTSIIWIASLILVLGHKQAVSAGRPASILEIKELFDVAIARPDRCRFIAELLQTEPPATKAEIAGEVALQKEYMAKKGEPPMSPALHQEVVLARSNAIVQAKSGFRGQHVEEYYSGIYSRMNITDEATVMPSFLRSNRSSYHDSYVNIHNPEFSPYASFTANHELHSAMLTKESDRYYRMSDLWRAVTIDQPLELPLVFALGDLKSLATNRLDGSNKFDADALLSSLRACLKTQSQPSETCEHETNHGQIDHGLAGLGLSFVVAVEPAVAPEPTEGSFHYPASRQHLERMEFVALHDFQGAAPQFHGPLDQRARVAAIGPDMSDAAAHRLALTEEAGQQLSSAIAVLEIGRQHRHQQQQANRVHQDVPLASVDLLARVVASLVARLRASDALAVDDPRTGLAISSSRHAHLFAQMSVNSHPKPIALPQSEIVIDRSPPGKVLRQIAPLAAGLCEIEDRIDQLPKGVLARPSRLGGLGKAVIDQLPFGISKVGSITHPQGNRGMYIQWRYFQNLAWLGCSGVSWRN